MSLISLVNVLFDIVDSFHQISLESRKVTPVGWFPKAAFVKWTPAGHEAITFVACTIKEALNQASVSMAEN